MNFVGNGRPLTADSMEAACSTLGLSNVSGMAALWSVLIVESRGFGFLESRRPKILFERHIFFRETGGRFAADAPDICAKAGGGYVGGGQEYARLERALDLCKRAGLSEEPALRSASWGLGQVMGFNAIGAGFSSVTDMIEQMRESEAAQLAGMVGFMKSVGLDAKLRSQDWSGFARRYNGPSFWQSQYDVKLNNNFDKFSAGITRDLRARAAQGALLFLGFNPGDPDGVVGQNTRAAVVAFRKAEGLGSSEKLDDEVFAAIMKKAGLD